MNVHVDRVARRWLQAARLLHVDRSAAGRLLVEFQHWAAGQGKRLGHDAPVGDGQFMAMTSMQTPWGEGRDIMVAFLSGRDYGGGFGFLGGSPLVKVFFPRTLHWRGLAADATVNAMRPFLMHELTHALDRLEGAAQQALGGDSSRLEDLGVSPKAYFNDPSEVRAYMRSIYEEIAPMALRLAQGPALEKLGWRRILESQLRGSPSWKAAERHFTPKNRKRVLKGLLTSLQDAAGRV
jgi:hypothetical protein